MNNRKDSNREKFKVESIEEYKDIILGAHSDFIPVYIEVKYLTRWATYFNMTVQRKLDSKYFRTSYSVGITDSQNHVGYMCEYNEFEEVFPIKKEIIVYE